MGIAALNLAKFRQAQAQLGDACQTADINEQALAKTKARGRLDLLELCKWIRMMPNSLKNIEPFSNMPNIGSTFNVNNKMSDFKIVYLIAIKIKIASKYVPISH